MFSLRFTGVVVLLSCFMAAPAEAQSGLRGGINLSRFFGSSVEDSDTHQGLNLGASLGLFSVGPVHLVGEVYYSQKGGKGLIETFQQPPAEGASVQPVEVGIDYVEIPVLARIDLGSLGGRLFPYLQGGPAFGWKLNCGVKAQADGTGEVDCADLLENLNETVKDYELGAVLGGGVDLAFGPGMGLNLDVRYTGGLTDVTKDAEMKNRSLTVMLGYAFSVPGMGGGLGGGPVGMPGG